MQINDLVEKYRADRSTYQKTDYNETQLRNDFINPFLECIGWDVNNKKGKSQFLRDVIQEESIEVEDENAKKNPDYTLRINGTRKLFIEAKKPSVNILKSAKAAFQTRRYGWSANLGISVLINFENIVIYDCRYKPTALDNEHVARYKVFSFDQYIEAFDEIKSLISFNAVNSGDLDELFSVNKRIGQTFDEYFLIQIESWREKLALSAIQSNPMINEEDMNFIIQRLLNRIIFLRICEDRTIEKYETIKGIKNYDELKMLFQQSDKKFNSGLFDFIEDALSLNINIEANVLIQIFNELYFPQSPYDFSVVDPAILSQIYEQFLSKRITLEEGLGLKMLETPEVSASEGVVPTPKIIAEQIVRDTLSPITEGKPFAELCKLKIADICCGSGIFLISAYDFLLEMMLNTIDIEKIENKDLIIKDGEEFTLTFKGKRSIVENNLYGVDINPYAVEVTQFSLLLKLLEGENDASITYFINHYPEKVLPNLKTNIKCGNSVVDSNFFKFIPEAIDNDQLLYIIKPFDWRVEFPFLIETEGFDAIIGNPPYVRIQNMKKYSPEEIEYYQSTYSGYTVASAATIDKYYVFIQRAINLLNSNGLLGYIVPHKFFILQGGKELRNFITMKCQIAKIIHFGVTQVFQGKSTYTAILILQNKRIENFEFKRINRISAECLSSSDNINYYKTENYNANPWIFLSPSTEAVFRKFNSEHYVPLAQIAEITVGLQTSADKIYIFKAEAETVNTYKFSNNGKTYEIEKGICRSAIYDLPFNAFDCIDGNAYMIFPYTIENASANLINEGDLQKNYPLAWKYLNEYKSTLEKRSFNDKSPIWYQYGRSQHLSKFININKLVWPVLSTKPSYVLDTKELFFTGGGNGPYYGLISRSEYSLYYILGILSHPIIERMVKAGASVFRGAYYSHGKQFLERLPIRKIDFNSAFDVERYEKVIELVKKIIKATEKLKKENNETRKIVYRRKVNILNDQLVQLISELYQVNDEEFQIVMNDEMLNNTLGE